MFGNDVIFNQQSGRELKFFTVCVFFILENISEVVEWAYGKSDKKIFKLLFVTTPSRNITFWSSNCPIMLASVRKSKRFLSVAPGFKVFMATDISGFTGLRSFPLQTSPNSPKNGKFRNLNCCTQIGVLWAKMFIKIQWSLEIVEIVSWKSLKMENKKKR